MALPVQHQALQQVGPAQERAVVGRRAADHDVVAAAGAGVAAVDHELVGAEPRLARLLVDRRRGRHAILPVRGRMDVDLDDAGIGRDADDVEARILRRAVALDMDRQAELAGGVLGRRDQFEIVLQRLDRRHEDAQPSVARLDRQRGAHGAADLAELLLDALLAAGRGGERSRGLAARHFVGALQFGGRRFVQDLFARRQRAARQGWIDRDDVGILRRRHIGQRAERQAIADRRIAGHQEQLAAPRLPFFRAPARSARCLAVPALHRQHIARRLGQAALEDARHAAALLGILQLGIGRIDIVRQLAFLEQPFAGVFIGLRHHLGLDAEFVGHGRQQLFGVRNAGLVVRFLSWRSGSGPTRPARRRRASKARRSSAAGFRPDTICPGRNAGSRRARSARAAGGSARRPSRAWSGRRRRCSIPRSRNRRSTRRSARRPWSGARPPCPAPHRPGCRARRAPPSFRRKTAW